MAVQNPLQSTPPPAKPPKRWYQRWWVWVLAAAFVLFIVLPGALVASVIATTDWDEWEAEQSETVEVEVIEPEPTVEAEQPSPTAEQTPSPSTEPEPEPESSLAEQVEAYLLESNGVTSFTEFGSSSPAFAITELEDVTSGTIRVHVQEPMTSDERDDVARWVYNMSCGSFDELDVIVVRDTSGIDHNWFASRHTTVCS